MESVLKFSPAVFTLKDEYQIMVPVNEECLMWVKIGDELFYDESNGILRSNVLTHRVSIPKEVLDNSKEYTVCYRKIIERKPYRTETEDEVQVKYDFRPVNSGKAIGYHISDTHTLVEQPVKTVAYFEEKYGKIDFLILNGDIADYSEKFENFDITYSIIEKITHGNIPVLFSRGNHDTRGKIAENFADHTPCDNGNSYYTFKIGDIWGILLDCGEDKVDINEEYGHTICCHYFRRKQLKFIENVIKNADNEYNAPDVKHKIVVSHIPFTYIQRPEPEVYPMWVKALNEHIKPDVMLCGHTHEQKLNKPDENTHFPVVEGSVPLFKESSFLGCGYIFDQDGITAIFNGEKQIIDSFKI